jgi:hypothetical protein
MALMLMLASPIGGALTGKVEPRYVIAGSTLIAAIGLYLFSGIDPRSGPFDIILPLSVMAFGIGLGMAQRTNIITSAVPIHKVGIASSILALARNIAGALGIAIFGTILQNSTKSKLLAITQQSSINASTPLDLKQGITLMTLKAQIASYGTVFVIAAIILFIGALTALLIRVDNNKISKTDVLIK